MAQDLTSQLDKLTNQVKFVQMIIKKELVVSGRKKLDIIRDLKSKGFKSFPKVAKPVVEDENSEAVEDEAEIEDASDNGYDYLLSVLPFCVSSLTMVDGHLLPYDGKSQHFTQAARRQRGRTQRIAPIVRQRSLESRSRRPFCRVPRYAPTGRSQRSSRPKGKEEDHKQICQSISKTGQRRRRRRVHGEENQST